MGDTGFSIKIKKGKNNVKCPVCKKMNAKEDTVAVQTGNSARYCCPSCVKEYIGNVEKTNSRLCSRCKESFQLKDLKNASEVDGNGNKTGKKKLLCPKCFSEHLLQSDGWARLISTVCNIYGCYDPTPAMLYQLKSLSESYGFTYEEMRQALAYHYIICEKPVKQGEGLGIIPFVYAEAKEFYKKKKITDEKNKNFNKPVVINETVTIKLGKHEPRIRTRKSINIEDIKIEDSEEN